MKKKLQRLSSALVATCMLATAAPIAMAASGFEATGHKQPWKLLLTANISKEITTRTTP